LQKDTLQFARQVTLTLLAGCAACFAQGVIPERLAGGVPSGSARPANLGFSRLSRFAPHD
jgi:hypothetical protein